MSTAESTKRLPKTLSFARILRIEPTTMEKLLWRKLRSRRFHDMKFRRQAPIGPYIVDFYCAEKKLRQHGHTVVRVTNNLVREWLPEALEKIGRGAGISYD